MGEPGELDANSALQRQPVIHAMLRGQVSLPCDLQPAEADDSVSLVLWYKDNSMVPIYSVDARSSPVQEARHKPGAWLEGRASFRLLPASQQRNRRHLTGATNTSEQATWRATDLGEQDTAALAWRQEQASFARRARRRQRRQMAEGPPRSSALIGQLTIEALASEDNGLYRCRVDFRRARSRFQEFELKIIVPADKPSIRSIAGASSDSRHSPETQTVAGHNTLVLGPYDEGAKVVLECQTQGGYPEPALTWWRDGRLVDDSYEIVDGQSGRVLAAKKSGAAEGVGVEEFRSQAQLVGGDWSRPTGHSAGATATATEATYSAIDGTTAPMSQQEFGASSLSSSPLQPQQQASKEAATQNRLIRNRLELGAAPGGLTRAELLANYSCAAWNTKLSGPTAEPPSSSAMIDMNLRPIKIQIESDRPPVLADKPLEVVCRAYGSRPAATITWYRGTARLQAQQHQTHLRQPAEPRLGPPVVHIQETVSADANVTTSTLSIVPQLEDGGQIITCRAENPLIRSRAGALSETGNSSDEPPQVATTIEDSWKLDVHYLPRATLALGDKLTTGQIREGHDVYFECSIKAHPQAHEIRWWFDGKELETNVTSGVIISNQSLVLQRVQRQQRGRYTCSAVNSVGESQSNSVHLRIQHAPICRDAPEAAGADSTELGLAGVSQQRHKSHYGAARLESVKVYCHVEADPSDALTYKWAFVSAPAKPPSGAQRPASRPEFSGQQLVYLDAQSISSAANETGAGRLVSVATYTPRSELDYGTLLCWAQNSLGQQAEPCAYQVVPAERPDPVRNCRLLNASDTQFAVACEPGYDGGIDQSFHMEVFDSRRHELVANVSTSGSPTPGYLLVGPGAGPSSGSGSGDASGGSSTSLAQNDADDSSEEPADGSSGGSATRSAGSQSASLVSSSEHLQQSRQQKQRHSSQQQDLSTLRPASGAGPSQSQSPGPSGLPEAVFITGPMLRPATDYFLSIYSVNSKGSSQPVAFTATTTNHLSASASSNPIRGDRPDSSSHLLSDVLSLSWNPFLLVCAITVALFALFASVTFVMMKYVDFSTSAMTTRRPNQRQLAPSDGASGGGGSCNAGRHVYGLAPSSAVSSSAGSSSRDGNRSSSYGTSGCAGAGDGDMSNRRENEYNVDAELEALDRRQANFESRRHSDNNNNEGVEDDENEDNYNNFNDCPDAGTIGAKINKRAKVIAVSNSNNNSALTSDDAAHLPLNGMPAQSRGLLSGSYLRLKFQQLASNLSPLHQQQQHPGNLRHSSSDNFINQLDASWSAGPELGQLGCAAPLPAPFAGQQTHERLFQGGTLPRNLAGLQGGNAGNLAGGGHYPRQRQQRPVVASANHLGYVQQIPLQTFDLSTYGAPPPQPAALASLMLAAPATSNRPFYSVGSAPVYPAAGPACLGEPAARVEHLLIGGKQYAAVQQRAAALASGRHSRHQLQLTSASMEPQRQQNYATGHQPEAGADCQRQQLVCASAAAAATYLDAGRPQQQCHQEGENYHADASLSAGTGACKTSDLGSDELAAHSAVGETPSGCEHNNCAGQIQCHAARLALVDVSPGAQVSSLNCLQLDSDSLGTQRTHSTETTNGSPSSGIAEMDLNYQQHGALINPYLHLNPPVAASHTQSNSSSTPTNQPEPDHYKGQTPNGYKSALVINSGGLKQAKKSIPNQRLPVQPTNLCNLSASQAEAEQHYSVYVESGDANNNNNNNNSNNGNQQAEYYVIPANNEGQQQSGCSASKTRVRLVGNSISSEQIVGTFTVQGHEASNLQTDV